MGRAGGRAPGAPTALPAGCSPGGATPRPRGAALRVLAAMTESGSSGSRRSGLSTGRPAGPRYEVLRGPALASPLGAARRRPVARPRSPRLLARGARRAAAEADLAASSRTWSSPTAGPRSSPAPGPAPAPGSCRARRRPSPSSSSARTTRPGSPARARSCARNRRRMRRRLEDDGAQFALVGADDLDRALDAFERFHRPAGRTAAARTRWSPGMHEMFRDAARALVPQGRLRVFVAEAGGEVVAVNILSAAGGVASGWNSGFDESWGRHSPSLVLTLHALPTRPEGRGADEPRSRRQGVQAPPRRRRRGRRVRPWSRAGSPTRSCG